MYRRKGVGNGILDLRGILKGCFLNARARLGWVSGVVMRWARWIGVVTWVEWGRLEIDFAWRLNLFISPSSEYRAKRRHRVTARKGDGQRVARSEGMEK